MMFDHVVLGGDHLRKTLDAERLGGRSGDEEDVRARSDRVCALDVERDLERPSRLVLLAGPLAGRWWRLRRRRALKLKPAERRHSRLTGHALLAAHRLKPEGSVENMQIVRNRVR